MSRRLLACFPLLLGLTACPGGPATDPAPANPGGGDPGSGTFDGDVPEPTEDDLVFVDTETGSRFNLLGQALDGPLGDDRVQLGLLPGMVGYWFAWSVHEPGARVWNNGINNEGEEILANDECRVPCNEIRSACFGGQDCIPSIDAPVWTTRDDTANLGYLTDADRVLGLFRPDGEARADPLDTLWTHEIVNDTWDGDEFSLTYCPLTATGLVLAGEQGGDAMRFGVSGNLYNANLVPYDRTTGSLYGQIRQVGFRGPNLGLPLQTEGVIDTTWAQWRAWFPDTEVLSDDVGPAGYPYGDYRTDHDDTFIVTNPLPDPKYPNKSMALGLSRGGETVLYAFDEIEAQFGEQAIVEDDVGGVPVLVVYDGRTATAAAFSRTVGGAPLRFELE